MSTTMPPTTPSATPPSPPSPRAGVPRWAWALIAVLAAIAIVAVTIAVTGRENDDDNTPAQPPATGQAADGCLGGTSDLDQALLTAQREAPLTPEGAAAFTATLTRWAAASPLPANKQETAQQVLAADATTGAQRASSAFDPKGSTSRIDFADGRYYLESFDGSAAVVSWSAVALTTQNGAALPVADLGGTVHLEAVNGMWRFQDRTDSRSLEDLSRIGTPYVEGC